MNRTTAVRTVVAVTALALLAGCSSPTGGEDLSAPDHADGRSTFGVDIDTASYDYAVAQLGKGMRPDPEQIRPEEFVNAFDQDYPEPMSNGIAPSADGTRPPEWYPDTTHLLRVGLQTRAVPESERLRAALTFVIDSSGSMGGPQAMGLVRDSLHYLVDELREGDSVAIVSYSDDAEVVAEMTPVSRREELHAAIEELQPQGSTNLAAGLATGYEVARRGFLEGGTNRVILLSDGLANRGATEAADILDQVGDAAREGVALLCVGVGGNYGDELMEQLADNGDGFAVYVSGTEKARDLFVTRLPSTLTVRAEDAKVQVSFNEDVVVEHRLVGYENRELSDDAFRDDTVDGGEMGPGHTVTALFELTLTSSTLDPGTSIASANVRWTSPGDGSAREDVVTVSAGDLDRDWVAAPARLRLDVAVAAFALVLRGSLDASMLEPIAAEVEELVAATGDDQVAALSEAIGSAMEMY